MSHISYIKNILCFALLGSVSAGALFGFWFSGPELELIRVLGAVSFVIITFAFSQDILHSKTNQKKSEIENNS